MSSSEYSDFGIGYASSHKISHMRRMRIKNSAEQKNIAMGHACKSHDGSLRECNKGAYRTARIPAHFVSFLCKRALRALTVTMMD